jgi:hypothetical protein
VDGKPSIGDVMFINGQPTRMDSAQVFLGFNFDGRVNGTPGMNWGSNCTALYDNVRVIAP